MVKRLSATTRLSAVLAELESSARAPQNVVAQLRQVRDEVAETSSLIDNLLFSHYTKLVLCSATPKATAIDTFNQEFLTRDHVGHSDDLLRRLVEWLVEQFGVSANPLWDNYLHGRVVSIPDEEDD